MLLVADIESCIPLSQEITDRNVRLEAKPGPLALLVSELSVPTSVSASAINVQGEEELKNYIPTVVNMMYEATSSITRVDNTSLLDCSHHDIKLDEFSDLIAQGVGATIHRAKAIVIPAIKRVEDAIATAFAQYEDRNIANIGIDEVGIDEVLDNDQVFDYFAQYKDRNKIDLRNTNFFPEMDLVGIAKLIEAGDPEINETLQTALLRAGEGRTLGEFIYRQLYVGRHLDNSLADLTNVRNLVRDFWGEDCVLLGLMTAYYIGKGLVVSLPEGVVAGVREVEHRVNLLTATLGMMIYAHMEHYRKQVGEKMLFPVGLPYVDRHSGEVNARYNIRVNKEVYAGYLANGGSPEAIYGSMVSERCTDVGTLISRREQFEKEYHRFVSINRAYTTNSRLELHVDAIRNEVYAMIGDTEELKFHTAQSGVFLRLRDGLRRMGADHVSTPENTYKFLRSLMCCVLYPEQPEIEKLITDIDNFELRDGEESLSTGEMANLVVVDLIVDWLVDQISIRGV